MDTVDNQRLLDWRKSLVNILFLVLQLFVTNHVHHKFFYVRKFLVLTRTRTLNCLFSKITLNIYMMNSRWIHRRQLCVYLLVTDWNAHSSRRSDTFPRLNASLSRGHQINHNDAIMGTMTSQINSLTIVYSAVYSGADQRKCQSFASLAFLRGFHR